MDRRRFQHGWNNSGNHPGFTHGDYFSAARRFFEEDHCSILTPASYRNSIHIDICLMKHGECYHPAKITVIGNGSRELYVLNVAVSDSGCRIIDAEIAALKRLGGLTGPSFIPRVFGQGSISLDGGSAVRMFLGEWFEEYHEFHLSAHDPKGLVVWGEQDLPASLSNEAAYIIYHQAASILTRYYNPETTEHISRWHHAAGDFVARCRGSRVDVRLITVRQYGPLLKMDEIPDKPASQSEQVLAALLIFLMGLSIRMRIDRLDGIGEMAWADDIAVIGTWSGFLEGLSNSYFHSPFLPDPARQFESHLATYGPSDIHDLAKTMAARLPMTPSEKAVVDRHLFSHVETLLETISSIGFL